jgi:hypothetical protein
MAFSTMAVLSHFSCHDCPLMAISLRLSFHGILFRIKLSCRRCYPAATGIMWVVVLSWQSCHSCPLRLHWLSCYSCVFMDFCHSNTVRLSCQSILITGDFAWLSCHGCRDVAFLFILSCLSCLVQDEALWPSFAACPVMPVMSGLSCQLIL